MPRDEMIDIQGNMDIGSKGFDYGIPDMAAIINNEQVCR
jgi:hypothetical protein